ncbi:hypothetical protein QAD02_022817 [Eretmocerus hayati]|uniref:Uncharacterized protein n=1 Tax=Eretmocerus hayati TaxID=131215 RepID=A0ACC2PU54_9HYME|nr:hypothetical protein QAD02_022817 [Eretmocerus hayati]
MRLKVVTVTLLLTLASKGDGRPKDPDPLDGSRHEAVAAILDNSDSRTEKGHPRDFKDYQSIDHSLRTVATQLLNASAKHDDVVHMPEESLVTVETPMQTIHISTRIEDAVGEKNHEEPDDSTRMKYGIPVNSKFGHFDITNQGQAMPMTDEEIERELAAATAFTQRIQPTTASMLSTWISLYPPSGTTDSNDVPDVKIDIQSNQIPTTDMPIWSSTLAKQSTTSAKPTRKNEMRPSSTPGVNSGGPFTSTTKMIKNSTPVAMSNDVTDTTSPVPTLMMDDEDKTTMFEKKQQTQRTTGSVSMSPRLPSSTRKPQTKASTTPKLKITTPKMSTTKFQKGNSSVVKTRPPFLRTTSTSRTDAVTSTSKIEKVTLKPTSAPFPNRTENTDRPQFITKMKASILTNGQKTQAATPTTPKFGYSNILSKINFTTTEPPRTKVPESTKIDNFLKVHPKQPVESTKIEVQPIRMSPMVSTSINRIGETYNADKNSNNDVPENTSTDVKIDVDPVTINTVVPDESLSVESTTSTTTTTTKKPRLSNKRKKNKTRRRRPTSSTTQLSTSPSDEETIYTTTELAVELESAGIQESKIEPESKAPPTKKKKKTSSSTAVQKPIGTQLYNFISRDVMPSVGVMSLVGLGLGLASYFLYPFGSVIARRNYEVEPNYKYNLEEYGGPHGLREEEVLSKVYSGMTNNQHRENRYNAGVSNEKNPNYYRYTGSDQDQARPQMTTRNPTIVAKNPHGKVAYKPISTTSYTPDYHKSEFKYPELTTTSNYHQRQQQPSEFSYTAGKGGIGNNRQFVVGNIPKQYSDSEVDRIPELPRTESTIDFFKMLNQKDETQAQDSPQAEPLVAIAPINSDASASIADRDHQPASFEEVEFSPAAVAVEHGPRSLRIFDGNAKIPSRRKRSTVVDDKKPLLLIEKIMSGKRVERSSVIQVIPSKSEIEKERKEEEEEEDLSNEILDIIDDALPGKSDLQKKKHDGKQTTSTPSKVIKLNVTHLTPSSTPIKDSEKTSSTPKTTTKADSLSTDSTTTSTTTKPKTSSTTLGPTEFDFVDLGETTLNPKDNVFTTAKPKPPETIFGFAKRVAQFKLRLGLTILKHASENLAKYIGNVQKRINGDES